MSQDIAADLPLSLLDELDVCLHAFLGERSGEEVGDVCVRV
jgi:hypothetical protein